mgnify:CR=1 FL=1
MNTENKTVEQNVPREGLMTIFPSQYDQLIQAGCAKYFPILEWLKLKAQLYAESALKPDAVSGAGAQGIAQFMPTTWPEARDGIEAPADATPFQPEYAIPGAAWYMRRMYRYWSTSRSKDDLWRLALASYNAGLGNIAKALRMTKVVGNYELMIQQLPHVTGEKNATETRNYVARIEEYYRQLKQ